MVSLEHHFYGESLPAPLTDRAALRHLIVENVLRDVKRFKDAVNEMYFGPHRTDVRWYVVGGSYAGALSVWVRQAYPHDFAAAWSSSGVVNAVLDFYHFDYHVARMLPGSCAVALRSLFDEFSDIYDGPHRGRKEMLDALEVPSYFTKGDVAWMLADGAAMAVQYGHKNYLCDHIESPTSDPQSALARYGSMLRALWGNGFTRNCYYSTECLSNPNYSTEWEGGNYAWVYQCCSQLAFWQVSYPHSLRLPEVNSSYFINQCRRAFGTGILPDTFSLNAKYGGAQPRTTHVVASQGSDDPWLAAGVSSSLGPYYPVLTAQCSGCGHCADLHASRADDHASLVAQRAMIAQYLNTWLGIATAKDEVILK